MAGDEIKAALFLCALQNAVRHGGVPQAGAVIGMVMGAHPELRKQAKEVSAAAKDAIADVAALSPEERVTKLQSLSPEMFAALHEKHEKKKVLPDLEGAEHGVVMRFAPNPSGPLHIGHARAAALNDAYVKQYGGRYILRIEDTDPKRVDPEAYEMVKEDIKWLGLGITETVTQSERFPIYYDLCKQLIERGGAYVCTCENEHFKALKDAKKACPCRDQPVETALLLWEKMLNGGFKEGEASVRVKTDLLNPDPAMRDYPIFRILDAPLHPKIGDARVYPLMNFSVVADDHLLGVTHVIRGKDHIANTRRQRYIYDHFGWKVPVYRHYGRMGIEGVVLSTSQMHAGIDEGKYTGWDDIHLGTLRALARRGISPDAVKNAMIAIGIGDVDISFSWDNLYAENKKIVDPVANRYFFVPDPLEAKIAGASAHTAHAMLHPGHEEKGTRTLEFTGTVLIPRAEIFSVIVSSLNDISQGGDYESPQAKISSENVSPITSINEKKESVHSDNLPKLEGSLSSSLNDRKLVPRKYEPKREITMLRLKDLFNVNITWDGETPSFSYGGDSLADARAAKARIIQWLPAQSFVPCTLLTQDGEMKGACEPAVTTEVGKVVQFERIAFARIDAVTESGVRAYFTHT